MNWKEIAWKMTAILYTVIGFILSIAISPIVGIYCLVKDCFINHMEFSTKDTLTGFIVMPAIMLVLLYAVCTRNREQVLEMTKNADAIDELLLKFRL
mgnify:CR=1 FL=1